MAKNSKNKPPTKEHLELAARLKTLLNYLNISQTDFADKVGVKKGAITHILNGRNFPSYQMIKGMRKNLPEINIDWFLFGKGSMLQNNAKPQEPELPFPTENKTTTPQKQTENDKTNEGNSEKKQNISETKRNIPMPYMISPDKIIMFYDDQTFEIYTLRQKNQKL